MANESGPRIRQIGFFLQNVDSMEKATAVLKGQGLVLVGQDGIVWGG